MELGEQVLACDPELCRRLIAVSVGLPERLRQLVPFELSMYADR